MRKLFIPLAKLLGIFMLIRPVSYLAYSFYIVFLSFFHEEEYVWSVFLVSSVLHTFSLFLALILIFKTEKVTDILRLPEDNTNLVGFDRYTILRIGLILIGFGTIIYAIPILIRSVIAHVMYRNITSSIIHYQELEEISSSMVRTLLGTCLVFLSKPIARFFDKQP
ncbi:MAG: hypothetical protein JW715_04750 [Sedimentisphaerales bacterium]|nr:hypothetical protein [Sedimentisphaerales bacterium]